MSKYAIWDKESDIITPIGELLTPSQWLERYPAAALKTTKWIVSGGAINGGVMMEYNTTIEQYARHGCDFSNCLTDQDHLDAIAAFEDAPPPISGPDANERIAAALEFQNALTLSEKGLAIEPGIVAKNWERGLWSADQAVLAAGEEAAAMGIVTVAELDAIQAKLDGGQVVGEKL